MSGLAVAQPLLDLFGRNPEFFVAADLARPDIVAFAVAIAVAVPLAATTVVLVARRLAGDRVADGLRSVALAFLATLLGLNVARSVGLDGLVPAVGLAVTIAAVVVVLERRSKGVALVLRYLGLAPLGFLALFLFASPTATLIWESAPGAAEDVSIGRPAPVVMVMLDEIPVSSLMTEDLEIDADLFPAFARLADEGTWYRNATSVSPFTVTALPTALAGTLPEGGAEIPNSIGYPRNLFSLLGGSYTPQVTETITELCSPDICSPDAAPRGPRAMAAGLRRSFRDSAVVFSHVVLPDPFRDELPPLDEDWAGFVRDDAVATASEDPPPESSSSTSDARDRLGEFFDERKQLWQETYPQLSGETVRSAVQGLDTRGVDPLLFFAHESFPHFPWERTPSGAWYLDNRTPAGEVDQVLGRDEFLTTQAYQRHLLQVGYADTLLVDLFDRLEAAGLWDDALVVVAADHGIAFAPADEKRRPTATNVDEVYRVPLFVKAPGQQEGAIDDRPALTTDILPTVVDLLDISVDWSFDGRSLAGDPRDEGPRPVFWATGPEFIESGVAELRPIVDRNHQRVPRPGWSGLAQIGRHGSVVGRQVDDLEVGDDADWGATLHRPQDFLDVQPGRDAIPLVIKGTADVDVDGPPDEALVALDGIIAGVIGFQETDDGWAFRALVDEALLTSGPHEVTVYEPTGSVEAPVLRAVPLTQ